VEDVDLGLRRAIRVKELLVARGVPEERILASSSSEAAPAGSTRVDLVLAFPPPARPRLPARP
jgi:outer membrane protein OmpA-like peptidoglycan-associated protein